MKARGANARGAVQGVDLQARVIRQDPKIRPQVMESHGFDLRIDDIRVAGLFRIRSDSEFLGGKQLDLSRSKLDENLPKFLPLVGVVGRNQNGTRFRNHRRREVYGRLEIKKLQLLVTRDHVARRLDDVLTEWLSRALARTVSKAKARKLLMAGMVRLDGRVVRIASLTLSPRTTIEARVDLERLFGDSTSRDEPFEMNADRILFEDDDLIVIDKPAGLPTHSTVDAARDNLVAAVTRFLIKRDGAARIGVHQRLDRDTSGVVLFTKSRRANAAVGQIFSSHLANKIYQALTVSRPALESEWTIQNYLGRTLSGSKRAKFGSVESGGSPAETFFRVLARHHGGTWIEAVPKTGRTHQIRVHLAEYGLPILGDDLYGSAASAPRLMLHASRLIFPHPVTRREIALTSPMPDDFARCLKRIR